MKNPLVRFSFSKFRYGLAILLSIWHMNALGATWCTVNDFDLAVTGNYVAVYNTTLTDAPNKYLYIANLTTEQGKAIYALLLTANSTGKGFLYGDSWASWTCGNLPAYNTATSNPEYVRMLP